MLNRRGFLKTTGVGALATHLLGRVEPAAASQTAAQPGQKPNILFVLMDNLGYGEVGAYGGGELRGAPTPRIDRLATEGTRLTNFNVEAQCTPSRSAILTGRFAIRSGTHSVPLPGSLDGLTQWEVTLAEALSATGYATGAFGKWHLGSSQGRLPNAQGFDEWFGIPRTTDEAMFPSQPGAKAAGIPFMRMMEGRKGQPSRELAVYDLEQRRQIDEQIVARTIDFMTRSVQAKKPFYAYVPFTLVHVPALPNAAFAGKTGNGDFADCLAEMDANVGRLLDAVDQLQVRDNTIVVFTSDNGPWNAMPDRMFGRDIVKRWDHGTTSPFRGGKAGTYEGGHRVPFIATWPGTIPAGRLSDAPISLVDLLPTLAGRAGLAAKVPANVDGVDIWPALTGEMKSLDDRMLLYDNLGKAEAIRVGPWKLRVSVRTEAAGAAPPLARRSLGEGGNGPLAPSERLELFHLLDDPSERYDQSAAHPDVVARLRARLDEANAKK